MPVRLAIVIAGAALGAYSVAIARDSGGFSFAGGSRSGTAIFLAAGWIALGVGVLHWSRRPGRVGQLLVVSGLVWFMGEWDSPTAPSGLVFTAGLVAYLATPAFLVHAVLAYPGGRLASWADRSAVGAGYLTTIGLVGLLPNLFFDPGALGCSTCPANLILVRSDPDLALDASIWGMRAVLVWALVTAVMLASRMARGSATRRLVVAPVAATGLVHVGALAWSLGINLQHGYLGTTVLDRRLWIAQGLGLIGVAVGVLYGLLRSRRTRRALTGLVVDLLAAASREMRDALAETLGDPGLAIAYPIHDGRYVDPGGRAVEVALGDRRTTTRLTRHGREVAVLTHQPGRLDNPELVDEIVSAAHLGLENERLRAEGLAQLADLHASRVRIIEAGDEERRRLERDLHDGAQQRLVGLSLALRLMKMSSQVDPGRLARAEESLQLAIDELRALARGLYPVALREEGLAAAILGLSESTDLLVVSLPDERFSRAIETTAFLVVAKAVAAGPASVAVTSQNGSLVLGLEVTGDPGLGDLADRVHAVDGVIEQRSSGDKTRLVVRLPVQASVGSGGAP